MNKEIKRLSRVIGIFPNDAAVIHMVGAMLEEQSGEWQVTRRYMSHETLTRVISPGTETQVLLETKQAA